MNNKLLMTFPRLDYESLNGDRDVAGNRFAMVTDGLKTSDYGPVPDPDICQSKVASEIPSYPNDGLPRNEVLKATLQLSQDPYGLTDLASRENVFRSKGFGFIIESRLGSEQIWIKTDTLCEPFNGGSSGEVRNEVILKRVNIFPEMRIKVVAHPNVGGALEWLNGVGQSTPLERLVKAQLWF